MVQKLAIVLLCALCAFSAATSQFIPERACFNLFSISEPTNTTSVLIRTPDNLARLNIDPNPSISFALRSAFLLQESPACPNCYRIQTADESELYLSAESLSFVNITVCDNETQPCEWTRVMIPSQDPWRVMGFDATVSGKSLDIVNGSLVWSTITDNYVPLAWRACSLVHGDPTTTTETPITCVAPSTNAYCTRCPVGMTLNTNSNNRCDMGDLGTLMDAVLSARQRQLTLDKNTNIAAANDLAALCGLLTWPWLPGMFGGSQTATVTDFVTQRTEAGSSDAEKYGELRDMVCSFARVLQSSPGAGPLARDNKVFNPIALKDLHKLIEQQLDILRLMDTKIYAWDKEFNLRVRAAQLWSAYEQQTQGFEQYTDNVLAEQNQLLASYSNVVLTLNANVSTALRRLSTQIDSSLASLNTELTRIADMIKKITTLEAVTTWTKRVLTVIDVASGIYLGMNAPADPDFNPADAIDDAARAQAEAAQIAKEHREWTGRTKMATSILGVAQTILTELFTMSDAIASRNPCSTTDCTALADAQDSLRAQIAFTEAMRGMTSMAQSLNASTLSNPTDLPDKLPQLALDTISAALIDTTMKAMQLSMTQTQDQATVAVATDVGVFTSLVRARIDAFKGWYSTAVNIQELKTSAKFLDAQLSLVNDYAGSTLTQALVAARGSALMRSRREALVAVVQQNLEMQLTQLNFVVATRMPFQPFTDDQPIVFSANGFTPVSPFSSSQPLGVIIPSTADLAQRFVQYLAMWVNAGAIALPGVSTTQGQAAEVVGGGVAKNQKMVISNMQQSAQKTSCWTAVEMHDQISGPYKNESLPQFTALRAGRPMFLKINPAYRLAADPVTNASSPLGFDLPSDSLTTTLQVPYWDVKVTGVRAYLLMSSELYNDRTITLSVRHSGGSLLVLNANGDSEQFFHNAMQYTFQYKEETACPTTDSTDAGLVEPSPFGLWEVRVISGIKSDDLKHIYGIRLEMQVSAHTNDESATTDNIYMRSANTNAASVQAGDFCVVPLAIANLKGDDNTIPVVVMVLGGAGVILFAVLMTQVAVYKYKRVKRRDSMGNNSPYRRMGDARDRTSSLRASVDSTTPLAR